MQKIYNLWTTSIEVLDDFITDQSVIQQLQKESFIDTTISGQNTFGLTDAQMQLYKAVSMVVMNYCINNNIDFSNLKINDLQKGCLYKYDESTVTNHLYEPHHDIAEGLSLIHI